MDKFENGRVAPVLPDAELDLVNGGFGFVEKGIIIDYKAQYERSTGAFFLRNTNTP